MVDIDYIYIQATVLRVGWLRTLGYEINIDEVLATITALLAEEVDKTTKLFGNYEVVKSKVEMELKTTSTLKKKEKLVRKLKENFGEGVGNDDEEDDEEDEAEEEQGHEPLSLT